MPAPAVTAPETWEPGEVTVAMLNARIRDKLIELQAAVTPAAPVDLLLITTPAGSVTTNESGTAQAAADGRFGLAWGRLTRGSALPATPTLIATLPVSITPIARGEAIVWAGSGNIANVEVRTDRGIYATALGGTPTVIRFTVTFPV